MNRLNEYVKKLLLTDYVNKQIDRKTIILKYGIPSKYINYFLNKNKIKIWDDFRKIPKELTELVIKEYTEKKLNRSEIAVKYKIQMRRVDLILNQKKIEKWDLKKTPTTKTVKNKSNDKRYYNPKSDKTSYAKIFYEFNN